MRPQLISVAHSMFREGISQHITPKKPINSGVKFSLYGTIFQQMIELEEPEEEMNE